MYEYRATVLRVVDGDTVDLDIDLGLDVHVRERCRLFGINAPEMRGESREAGEAAKEWLVNVVWPAVSASGAVRETAKNVVIQTLKDNKGKYGRYLAILIVDGENINDAMIAVGHAVEYLP